MVGFPDGPLTGAPINFPRAAQPGECCPPAFLQLQSYTVTYDLPDAEVLVEGCKLCNYESVEVVGIPDLSTGVVNPTLLAVSCDELDPPKIDQMLLTLDTDRARGAFAVKITNDCGCSELVFITLVAPV
jgi:hypothetical protein